MFSSFGGKGNVMAFVYEIVQEKDYDFFKSMGLKNCWGTKPLIFLPGITTWTADRVRNAFLVGIGGGFHDMPDYYDLWWNGHTIRMEIVEAGIGNYDVGVDMVWFINKVPIPKEIWQYKEEVMNMITEAFSVNMGWCRKECLKSITVNMSNAAVIEAEY